MKQYPILFSKGRLIFFVLFLFIFILFVFFAKRNLTVLFSPHKDFKVKTFSFSGQENMSIVAYDFNPTNQSEWLGLQIPFGDRKYVSIYLKAEPGSAKDYFRGDTSYTKTTIHGIHGYISRSLGTPDDSSHTDSFVFEMKSRTYAVSFSKPPTGFYYPYSLEQAVKDFTPYDIPLQDSAKVLPIESPTAYVAAPAFPQGCQSSDQQFCDLTEELRRLLKEQKFSEIVPLSTTIDFSCGNSEYQYPVCDGKPDGSIVPAYVLAVIASEGSVLTEQEFVNQIDTTYKNNKTSEFQMSRSNNNVGQIIFLNADQTYALGFHTKKIDNVWKIDLLNLGVNLGPGGFIDAEKLNMN